MWRMLFVFVFLFVALSGLWVYMEDTRDLTHRFRDIPGCTNTRQAETARGTRIDFMRFPFTSSEVRIAVVLDEPRIWAVRTRTNYLVVNAQRDIFDASHVAVSGFNNKWLEHASFHSVPTNPRDAQVYWHTVLDGILEQIDDITKDCR